MTENTFADILRSYVVQHGPKAAVSVIVAALDEEALAHPRKPVGTMASINANVLRKSLERMV